MYQEDQLWIDDPTILTNKHRLIEFFPTENMKVTEKVNAVTRLLIYLGVLLSIIYMSSEYMFIPLIGMAIMYVMKQHSPQLIGGGGLPDNPVQMPTKDNPFMNVLISDYVDNPTRKPAGDLEDPEVRALVDKHFNSGLYKDVNDVWDHNNSQRQFYTNPSTTIPNDRDSFAKWCWGTPMTCKEGNLQKCLKYEDVRAHGQI
jgi:hypothetical protein